MKCVPSLNLVYTEEDGYVTADVAEAQNLVSFTRDCVTFKFFPCKYVFFFCPSVVVVLLSKLSYQLFLVPSVCLLATSYMYIVPLFHFCPRSTVDFCPVLFLSGLR